MVLFMVKLLTIYAMKHPYLDDNLHSLEPTLKYFGNRYF